MADPQVREISIDELVAKRKRGEPFILVDVLAEMHFAHIHLPASINIPLVDLRELAPLLFGKEEQIIVYCTDVECEASETAAKILMQLDFTDVLVFTGGIRAWVEAGLPVVHTPHAPPSEGKDEQTV
jgi:rhodanese-related sulfurtransferase